LAGNIDKAFLYLNKAVVVDKWSNLFHILSDSDLSSLHADKRWQSLIDTVRSNKEKAEATLNKPLVALLDTVYNEDQTDRRNVETVQKQFGRESKQMDSLWRKISYQDSVNLIRIKNIIDTYGWLGPDEVGQQGATTIFLVIQHSDSLTQVTYVPKMREAVKKGKAQPESLALLEDRILTNQGKEQIYGSQVRRNEQTGKNEFFPIQDERNVNKRRASVGLQPLEDYAKFFDIVYILPKAKKKNK
jgi:sucrose-6-phosphate hydrolase SacC (GH32 family)